MKFYLRGGVGDILQSLWFIKNNTDQEYIVHTHFDKAPDMFDYLGAKNCHFYKFKDMDSHNEQVDIIKADHAKENQDDISETPRAFYSDLDFGGDSNEIAENFINSFSVKRNVIGIHPFRSDFAYSVYNHFNLPAKTIPVDVTKKIINDQNNYLIFGSKKELSEYGLQESDNVKFVSFDNIIHSLSTVKYCNALIGLDSCFKSMSSMQRIKTICIIGDFKDETRDAMFVNQYVKDGVMKIYSAKNLEDEKESVVNFILDSLNG
jgi:ADP-heptose:LPS heptosyltransferase